MDAVLLSRLQFMMTVGFHFLFPPITIGLAWLLVVVEGVAWRKKDPVWESMGRFFGKLLALTFAVGVATGVTMEFQFGTNWAKYSKFVGDIFGAPLAAEAVIAFFLESGFMGLYLFGRNKVAKKWHWFSILMVAVGSTISAFWILVANSWQQTPTGFTFNPVTGRAELTSFFAAVNNPSTWYRFAHTVTAAVVCGSFFMAGIAAYLVRKDRENPVARGALKLSVIVGLISSILVCFPTGHEHAKQVARTQPEKFAAIEGLYTGQNNAPLVLFAYPVTPPPDLKAKIELRGLLSWMAFGDINAHVKGLNEFDPKDVPKGNELWLTFVSFHNMVILGGFFVMAMGLSMLQLLRGKLWDSRFLLKILLMAIPLPLFACQLGWMAAEVGRQPWIVYRLLKTADAISPSVSAGHVLFSLILFGLIYLLLGILYLFLLTKKVQQGPEPVKAIESLVISH